MAPPATHYAYWKRVDELIRLALEEDLPGADVTTTAILGQNLPASAVIRAKEKLTVSGLAIAARVFEVIDPAVRWKGKAGDGESVLPGARLAELEGPAAALLAGERTALNFLQHLSGIATVTAGYVERVKGLPASVLDTRKTLPGWRLLEKEAVRDGGGTNHRFSLSDGVLIKDNHISLAGGVTAAIERAKGSLPRGSRIEIEASSLQEVRDALRGGVDVILLDNATPELLAEVLEEAGDRAAVEVSGGITVSNLHEMAATGVTMISIGALTHSAGAVDISMDMERG